MIVRGCQLRGFDTGLFITVDDSVGGKQTGLNRQQRAHSPQPAAGLASEPESDQIP